ncbi:hypothetical protein AGDE_15493 [Angomonas deanei]|nr:hypothetical protein AGDE_15493 [Angomonas deanei]|eukprot:EPY18970.1 hypothetical protein AGDE_15493 [Angomonas deanei]
MTDLRYRRLQWKCDSLNEPSRRAAERLGYVFEGVFRNATMLKGRNRDTAYYSITDEEWGRVVEPRLRAWLASDNFDSNGRQKCSLKNMTVSKL